MLSNDEIRALDARPHRRESWSLHLERDDGDDLHLEGVESEEEALELAYKPVEFTHPVKAPVVQYLARLTPEKTG